MEALLELLFGAADSSLSLGFHRRLEILYLHIWFFWKKEKVAKDETRGILWLSELGNNLVGQKLLPNHDHCGVVRRQHSTDLTSKLCYKQQKWARKSYIHCVSATKFKNQFVPNGYTLRSLVSLPQQKFDTLWSTFVNDINRNKCIKYETNYLIYLRKLFIKCV